MRFLLTALFLLGTFAEASAQRSSPVQIGLDYNYVHTNAPPDGCGCFSANGGGVNLLYSLNPRFELLSRVSITQANGIGFASRDLRLTSVLFGGRFLVHPRRFTPYGEAAIGFVHAAGTLLSSEAAGSSSINTFAATVGGGLQFNLTKRLAIKAVQADYHVTQVPNGSSDHQNNLLVSTGVLLRF